VQNVDRILVIDNGKIAEEGTHAELLEKGGLYKTMWDEYQQAVAWKIGTNNAESKGGQHA
jgi:ATP-binding cassette subfamily B protein